MGRISRRGNGPGLALSLALGKLEPEQGAPEVRAPDADRPAMGDDEPFHGGEAETNAGSFPGGRLAAHVRLEDAISQLLRYARTAVRDLEHDDVAAGAHSQLDAPHGRFPDVLQAVPDQVRQQHGE